MQLLLQFYFEEQPPDEGTKAYQGQVKSGSQNHWPKGTATATVVDVVVVAFFIASTVAFDCHLLFQPLLLLIIVCLYCCCCCCCCCLPCPLLSNTMIPKLFVATMVLKLNKKDPQLIAMLDPPTTKGLPAPPPILAASLVLLPAEIFSLEDLLFAALTIAAALAVAAIIQGQVFWLRAMTVRCMDFSWRKCFLCCGWCW